MIYVWYIFGITKIQIFVKSVIISLKICWLKKWHLIEKELSRNIDHERNFSHSFNHGYLMFSAESVDGTEPWSTEYIHRSWGLTHFGQVTPYGVMGLGQHWFRLWLVAWRHQAITRTNVDHQYGTEAFTRGHFCWISTSKLHLKTKHLKPQPHLPRDKQLISFGAMTSAVLNY